MKKYLGWLIPLAFFDLLFLPRLIGFYGIPLSSLVILFFAIISNTKLESKIHYFIMFTAILIISVLAGTFASHKSDIVANTARAMQLSYIVFVYGLALVYSRPNLNLIRVVLRLYSVYLLAILWLFLLERELYLIFTSIVYPESLEQLEFNSLFSRLSLYFTDPNTMGYLVLLCFAMLISLGDKKKWLYFNSVVFISTILVTQSRGAILGVILLALMMLFNARISASNKIRAITFAVTVPGILFFSFPEVILEALEVFFFRFEGEEDFGNGRLGKYKYMLQQLNVLPIGFGYEIYKDGEYFRPHSDFIRFIMSYGYLALILFLSIFRLKSKKQYIFLTAGLVPFFVNTLIDDWRLFSFFVVGYFMLGKVRSRADVY